MENSDIIFFNVEELMTYISDFFGENEHNFDIDGLNFFIDYVLSYFISGNGSYSQEYEGEMRNDSSDDSDYLPEEDLEDLVNSTHYMEI